LSYLTNTSQRLRPAVRDRIRSMQLFQVEYELSTRMVFNIKVPFLDVSLKRMDIPDLYLQTGPAFYKALSVYEELLPHLLKLASLRNALHMMSVEIEKTRRRSNALEYNVVPELEKNY